MAKGQEAFETSWLIDNYQTSFDTTDLVSSGYDWHALGQLNLSANAYIDDPFEFTLPNYGKILVITVPTVIGAAITNPQITISYADQNGATQTGNFQLLPGMPQFTSIHVNTPTGIGVVDVTNMNTNVFVSGTIVARSPDFISENFNAGMWSAASPGL